MHELLAVCLLAVDRDSLESNSDTGHERMPLLADTSGLDNSMQATLDRRYIEHDTFGLFQEVMKAAKPFYEWRAEEGPVSENAHMEVWSDMAM